MQLHHASIAGACEPATRLRIAQGDASTNEREARFRRDSCATRIRRAWRRRRRCIGLRQVPPPERHSAHGGSMWRLCAMAGSSTRTHARTQQHAFQHPPNCTPPCVAWASWCGNVGRNMTCKCRRVRTGRWYQYCPQALTRAVCSYGRSANHAALNVIGLVSSDHNVGLSTPRRWSRCTPSRMNPWSRVRVEGSA